MIYARKFHKQTEKWDATTLMRDKKYTYIPELSKDIEGLRCAPYSGVKRKLLIPSNHPARIRASIGNTAPESLRNDCEGKKVTFQIN